MRRFGSDGCQQEENPWRRMAARFGLRAAVSFLSGLTAAAAVLIFLWIRQGNGSAALIAAVAGFLFLLTEWISRRFLRERYPDPKTGERSEFRLDPHPFAHFLPSRQYADISEEGFRITQSHPRVRRRPPPSQPPQPLLYLAGDCTLFENHLLPEETFAYQLSLRLPEWEIANAGVPHYTALHSYNRLVTDLVNGIRPACVLFHSAANDVLGFIHHKDGIVRPDHSHWYRCWESYGQIYQKVARWPTASLRLFLFSLLCDGKKLAWSDLVEEVSATYERPESVRTARELFDPSGFVTCLQLFRSAAQAIGAQLVLTTFYYNRKDMDLAEPRRTYAWGMDRLNEEIRRFASLHGLPLIDLARELDSKAEIRNKWHYTPQGNRIRAEAVARHWKSGVADPGRRAGALLEAGR